MSHGLWQRARTLARQLALAVPPIRRLHTERAGLRRRIKELKVEVAGLRKALRVPSGDDSNASEHGAGSRAKPSPAQPGAELDFLQATSDDVLRWDREWCRYLARVSHYFTRKAEYSKAELALVNRLRSLPREQLYRAKGPMSDHLRLWYDGADLAGKKVAEVGCGPSQLGRDLAPLVSEYVGLDYSELALSVARLVCAPNCRFLSLRDKVQVGELKGTRTAVLCRHFFIHQNIENARWVLRLAHHLLCDGGLLVADFYWPDGNRDAGVRDGSIRPASDRLRDFASTMFQFSEPEVRSLVDAAGFDIEADWIADDLPRRYFRLVKRCGSSV